MWDHLHTLGEQRPVLPRAFLRTLIGTFSLWAFCNLTVRERTDIREEHFPGRKMNSFFSVRVFLSFQCLRGCSSPRSLEACYNWNRYPSSPSTVCSVARIWAQAGKRASLKMLQSLRELGAYSHICSPTFLVSSRTLEITSKRFLYLQAQMTAKVRTEIRI